MPAYKATFFFEGLQAADIGAGAAVGWTESWYKSSDAMTIQQAITDPDLENYLTYRLAVMSSVYRCSFIRVSQDDQPRRFKLRGLTSRFGTAIDATAGEQHSQVQCAVLADLEKLPNVANPAEKVHHRRFLIRGLPADLIDGNVIKIASPYVAQLKRFLDFVGNHETGGDHPAKLPIFTWGIRYGDPAVVPNPIKKAIVSTDNNRVLLLTLTNAIAAVRGDKYTVRGIDSPATFNKVWTYIGVVAQDAINYQAFGTARRRLQGSYTEPGRGVLFPNKFLYGTIDQYAIIGLRTKRTGRVFRQLRGRSSNR